MKGDSKDATDLVHRDLPRSHDVAIRRLAELDSAQAPIGWEASVLRTIREEKAREDALSDASVPTPGSKRPERTWSWRRDMFVPASSFKLAALVLLMVFGVREQHRNSQLAERKATIASVVEFVGLETEMAQKLAEIDQEEARRDEAFHALRLAQLESSQSLQGYEVRQPDVRRRSKVRMTSPVKSACEGADRARCGL